MGKWIACKKHPIKLMMVLDDMWGERKKQKDFHVFTKTAKPPSTLPWFLITTYFIIYTKNRDTYAWIYDNHLSKKKKLKNERQWLQCIDCHWCFFLSTAKELLWLLGYAPMILVIGDTSILDILILLFFYSITCIYIYNISKKILILFSDFP